MGTLLYFNKNKSHDSDYIRANFQRLVDEATLGRKQATKNKCKSLVKNWLEFKSNIENPTSKDALMFIEHCRTELKHTNKTIKITLQLLKRVYETDVFDNAISLIKVNHKKPEKRKCEYIPFELARELLDLPDITKPTGRRDRALIALMLAGGLRISEALNLRISDINITAKGTLFVVLRETKKGYPDEQTISATASAPIIDYLKERAVEADSEDIFLTSYDRAGKGIAQNRRNDRRSMSRRFEKYVKQLGLKHITPHSCRRTFVTKLLDQQLNYKEVQVASRHESIAMVEVYDKRAWGKDNNPALKLIL